MAAEPAGVLQRRRESPAFGFALSSEENDPLALVRQARIAEEVGLDFLSISDHFHPWLPVQGNSPFVWSVLGGIAAATTRIVVGTGVTCPILRIHPVLVAHAAATAACMFEGRFYLGLGTGEALNELVTGESWPTARQRLERLEEAIKVMRELLTGDSVTFEGKFYTVIDARLYTRPEEHLPTLVAAASPGSAELAAAQDGLIATGPDEDVFGVFEEHGGRKKPHVGQITVCWDESEARAKKITREYWPTTVLNWDTKSSVSTPEVFEDITKSASEDEVVENILCGPDIEPIVEKTREYVAAGFDHIYFHQVGTRQEEFLAVMEKELLPRLRKLSN